MAGTAWKPCLCGGMLHWQNCTTDLWISQCNLCDSVFSTMREQVDERHRERVAQVKAGLPSITIRKPCKQVQEHLDAWPPSKGLIFFGPPGSGKTTSLVLVGKHTIKQKLDTKYYTLDRLLEGIKEAYTTKEKPTHLQDVDALLLDNVYGKSSDWCNEQLQKLFEAVETKGILLYLATPLSRTELHLWLGDIASERLGRISTSAELQRRES